MIENSTTIFRAMREPWNDGIGLHIAHKHQDGQISVADNMELRKLELGALPGTPVLQLTYGEAQALIDELWSVGLRPSEGTGSAGALAATQRHLDDMQGIAIGLLRQQGVEL